MGAESQLQKKCIKHLEEQGVYHLNIYGSGRTGKGAPDLIACINGRFVAFELKVGDNDLSPAQEIHMRQIIRSEGDHYTPRSLEEFKEIVEGLI